MNIGFLNILRQLKHCKPCAASCSLLTAFGEDCREVGTEFQTPGVDVALCPVSIDFLPPHIETLTFVCQIKKSKDDLDTGSSRELSKRLV